VVTAQGWIESPHVAALVTAAGTDKRLRLAAIDAGGSIRPREAAAILNDLTESDDEDIVEAVYEAVAMAEGFSDEDDEDEDNGPSTDGGPYSS
jgi:hypothetical protein